jgi:dethiobiotin synthetase
MHRKRVVLLGTGTGVGKTYVSRQLALAWRRSGVATLALKPLESGYDPRNPESSDAAQLAEAAGAGAPPLYFWSDPVSPHLAARRNEQVIELRAVAEWVRGQEDKAFGADPVGTGGITLIESAGGVFSPLGAGFTNLDLALRLQPALIVLAAPDSLGVLHDVTATLRAMAPLRPQILALSHSRAPDASTGTNAAELENVVFPSLGTLAPVDRSVISIYAGDKADLLADRLLQRLDLV